MAEETESAAKKPGAEAAKSPAKAPARSSAKTPAKSSAESPAKSKPAATKTRAARQSHPARNRFLILLALLLAALATGGYFLTQLTATQARLSELAGENTQLSESLAAQSAELESMRAQIAAPAEPVPMNMAPLRELEQRLRAETETLQAQLGAVSAAQRNLRARPELDWKISEAGYLLHLANLKLQLEADVDGAIVLFESADRALSDARRDDALHIRQTIAEELAQLRALPTPNREDIYFRLESLGTAVAQLQVPRGLPAAGGADGSQSSAVDPVQSEAALGGGWFAASLDYLGDIFVWRRWEERPDFERIAGRESYLRESLGLHIKQAQLALLLRDAALYRANLQSGLELLRSFTGSGGGGTDELDREFNELLRLDIAPQLPSLNQSLNQVGAFLASEPQ